MGDDCPRCGATVTHRTLASGTTIYCGGDWGCHFAIVYVPGEPTQDDRMIALAAKASLLFAPEPTAADIACAAQLAERLGLHP